MQASNTTDAKRKYWLLRIEKQNWWEFRARLYCDDHSRVHFGWTSFAGLNNSARRYNLSCSNKQPHELLETGSAISNSPGLYPEFE